MTDITKNPYLARVGGCDTVQNYMNMVMQLAGSWEVLLLVIADRMDYLVWQNTLPFEKRIESEITYKYRVLQEIYLPLVDRLGLDHLYAVLVEKAFQLAEPDEYNRLAAQIKPLRARLTSLAKSMPARIQRKLLMHGISGVLLQARIKTLYSISRKLKAEKDSIADILDLLAIRVILPVDESIFERAVSLITGMIDPCKAGSEQVKRSIVLKVKHEFYDPFRALHYNIVDQGTPIELVIMDQADYYNYSYGIAKQKRKD